MQTPYISAKMLKPSDPEIKRIYHSCEAVNVIVSYVNEETAFTIEFSRIDRNITPKDGGINGGINEGISEAEILLLDAIKQSPNATNAELAEMTGKSARTISRLLSLLKGKGLIERIGSNKSGYWKTI